MEEIPLSLDFEEVSLDKKKEETVIERPSRYAMIYLMMVDVGFVSISIKIQRFALKIIADCRKMSKLLQGQFCYHVPIT